MVENADVGLRRAITLQLMQAPVVQLVRRKQEEAGGIQPGVNFFQKYYST